MLPPGELPPFSESESETLIEVDQQMIVDLVRDYWRIGKACQRGDDDESPAVATIRSVLDHIWETFAIGSIKILDPAGEPYNPGLKLDITGVQITGGSAMILETLRPGVSIKGVLCAPPQVIVGK